MRPYRFNHRVFSIADGVGSVVSRVEMTFAGRTCAHFGNPAKELFSDFWEVRMTHKICSEASRGGSYPFCNLRFAEVDGRTSGPRNLHANPDGKTFIPFERVELDVYHYANALSAPTSGKMFFHVYGDNTFTNREIRSDFAAPGFRNAGMQGVVYVDSADQFIWEIGSRRTLSCKPNQSPR